MTISIALCTCNGARYIEAQLASILAQTRLPDEVVISDDHSTDDSLAIIRRWAASAPFPVRVSVNDEALRSTKNFEKAIRMCEGDIILLSDQDDVWYRDRIAVTEHAFVSDDRVGLVFGNADLVDAQLVSLRTRLLELQGFDGRQLAAICKHRAFDYLLKKNFVTGATMGFRANLKDALLPIPSNWVQDGWIALLAAASTGVVFLEEPVIRYRQHTSQQIGCRKLTLFEQRQKAKQSQFFEYSEAVAQYTKVLERLTMLSNSSAHCLSQVDRKLKHLQARAALPQKRLLRIARIANQLLGGKYHLYSNGWRAALKDLMINLEQKPTETQW